MLNKLKNLKLSFRVFKNVFVLDAKVVGVQAHMAWLFNFKERITGRNKHGSHVYHLIQVKAIFAVIRRTEMQLVRYVSEVKLSQD